MIILKNQYIRLEFSENGDVISIINPETKRNYMADGGSGMFRLTLTETYQGNVLPGNLILTSKMAKEVKISREKKQIIFEFANLDGMEITVITTVELKKKESIWKISVLNNTQFAIKEIEYPWIILRTPLGNMPETERFMVPKMDGILLGNPGLHPWQANEKGEFNERYWYPGEGKQTPRNLSVQMTAYYDKQEGVLLYAADKEGHPKRLGPILIDNDKVDLSVTHLRAELGNHDFQLEYSIIMQLFEGDWKTAALLYKKWAANAPWCSKTIEEREDIPKWIKNGAFFLSFRLRYQKEGEEFLDKAAEFVRRWQDKIDMPMVAMMCGWEKIGEWAGPDYFPPYGGNKRFSDMCSQISNDGNKPFTFALSGLKLLIRRRRTKSGEQPQLAIDYNGRKIFREQYINSAALDINGVPIYNSDIDAWDGVHSYACPTTAQAKEQICGASLKMLKEYGVIMQQADQVLGGGSAECYSKMHNHAPGRGLWQVQALKHIYDETRKSCKEINPDFVLSEEWISEPFIQHLDIYHARNYDKPQGGFQSIPLFSFLYHEYIPCYAGDWTSFLPTNKSGVHFHGWNFVCGNLPAGSPIDMLSEMHNHLPEDADSKIMKMAQNACAAFKNNTKFLIKGKMLPTEDLAVEKLKITIKGLDFGWNRTEIEVSSVLHMFWESPDGSIACALANISDVTQTASIPAELYAVNLQHFSIERNGICEVEKGKLYNGFIELELLPQDAVMVYLNK